MKDKLTENIIMQKGKYRPSRRELKQLVEGNVVVLSRKKFKYYPEGIESDFLIVKIKIRTPKKFIGSVIKHTPSGILTEDEVISFSTKNIVKTPYDDLDLKVLNFYHNYTVKASIDVMLRKEINYMERVESKVKKYTGWLFLSGYEDEIELENKYNYVEAPVYELIEIDPTVILYLLEEPNCAYQRMENGEFEQLKEYTTKVLF